jgi:cyclic pyranopterin phosphate synthase
MVKKIKRQKNSLLIDNHGRIINYLRLSVTDRCNLKCRYCHPPQKINYLDRKNICSFKELLQIVEAASRVGLDKIRLTGGELFLRKDVIEFIGSLHEIEGLREISLTTNGTLLLPHLKKLKEMGLKRINISLDTLSKDLYFQMTGSHEFFSVMDAIHKALDEGFNVKINMVALRGVNEAEIPQFLHYFLENSVEVRFIEFMPLCGLGWKEDYFFSYRQIKEIISKRYDLHPLASSGVAQEFILGNGNGLKGKMGIIAPVTRSFCSSCTRLRLSASGELRPCLFSTKKVDILPLLRGNFSSDEKELGIKEAFKRAAGIKPESMSRDHVLNDVYIRCLGG